MDRPKISIVTPNFNQAEMLEETIRSVVDQQYPNLEYIVIDAGSTDGSVETIRKYSEKITHWISEPDQGLYHGLQKGFDMATGDIFGWINSDDKLHADCLEIIAEVFESFPEVNWITGCPTGFDDKGRVVAVGQIRLWSKYDFYLSDYKWIQQESTFWRKSLWQQSGAKLRTEIQYAADFELWLRFFRYDQLYTVRTILGGFRFRITGQLSVNYREKYLKEVRDLIEEEARRHPQEVRKNLEYYHRLNNWEKNFIS